MLFQWTACNVFTGQTQDTKRYTLARSSALLAAGCALPDSNVRLKLVLAVVSLEHVLMVLLLADGASPVSLSILGLLLHNS